MDKYRRVPRPKEESKIEENEIRVTTQGKPRNFISYATTLFNEKNVTEVQLKAMGGAISKTVTIAEIIKRRIPGLHSLILLESTDIVDVWEPLEEGLDRLETVRHVSSITITLSKKQLDANSPGYQPPLPADQVKEISSAPPKRLGGPRRGGEGSPEYSPIDRDRPTGRPRGPRPPRGPPRGPPREPNDFATSPPSETRRPMSGGGRGRGRGGRGRGRYPGNDEGLLPPARGGDRGYPPTGRGFSRGPRGPRPFPPNNRGSVGFEPQGGAGSPPSFGGGRGRGRGRGRFGGRGGRGRGPRVPRDFGENGEEGEVDGGLED